MKPNPRNPISPKKLHLSKWTATHPQHKEKHFIVTKVIEPEPPVTAISEIEMQAVHSGRSFTMHWRELSDSAIWKRGWL